MFHRDWGEVCASEEAAGFVFFLKKSYGDASANTVLQSFNWKTETLRQTVQFVSKQAEKKIFLEIGSNPNIMQHMCLRRNCIL